MKREELFIKESRRGNHKNSTSFSQGLIIQLKSSYSKLTNLDFSVFRE